jgi:hypothetical protein
VQAGLAAGNSTLAGCADRLEASINPQANAEQNRNILKFINRAGGNYFCTVKAAEYWVFSHMIFKTPPLGGVLETAIVS